MMYIYEKKRERIFYVHVNVNAFYDIMVVIILI